MDVSSEGMVVTGDLLKNMLLSSFRGPDKEKVGKNATDLATST